MPLDFLTVTSPPPAKRPGTRGDRGRRNYLVGLAAEAAVARQYQDCGHQLLARRWRGASGELDLVFRKGSDLVVVEVKRGRTHTEAAEHIGPRQIRRIFAAADEYLYSVFLAGCFPLPQIDLRIDLALVDGIGQIAVQEAAFFL